MVDAFLENITIVIFEAIPLFQFFFNNDVQQKNSWWKNFITHDFAMKYPPIR